MARIHLFEFLDLEWFPEMFRKAETDYLEFCVNKFDLFAPSVPLITKLLKNTNSKDIVDLGSGGGGPWKKLFPQLTNETPETRLTFTDLRPNTEALSQLSDELGEQCSFISEPVNALSTKLESSKTHTLFLALHHFDPHQVKSLINNTIENRSSLACFEAQRRAPRYILSAPIIFLMVLVLMPFVKGLSLGRLIFTYLIPIIPLCIMFDGVVSALRTYSEQELEELFKSCDNWESYHVQIETLVSGPNENVVLALWPKS